MPERSISRRRFLGGVTAAAAFAVVPRHGVEREIEVRSFLIVPDVEIDGSLAPQVVLEERRVTPLSEELPPPSHNI